MFDFLTELTENNNKEWFDAHKAQYESATRIISYASFFWLYDRSSHYKSQWRTAVLQISLALAGCFYANLLKTKKILVRWYLTGNFYLANLLISYLFLLLPLEKKT